MTPKQKFDEAVRDGYNASNKARSALDTKAREWVEDVLPELAREAAIANQAAIPLGTDDEAKARYGACVAAGIPATAEMSPDGTKLSYCVDVFLTEITGLVPDELVVSTRPAPVPKVSIEACVKELMTHWQVPSFEKCSTPMAIKVYTAIAYDWLNKKSNDLQRHMLREALMRLWKNDGVLDGFYP